MNFLENLTRDELEERYDKLAKEVSRLRIEITNVRYKLRETKHSLAVLHDPPPPVEVE